MGESQEMDIGYVANLARIELSDEENEKSLGLFSSVSVSKE